MLVFMLLGFLGSIEFTRSAGLATQWVFIGGSVLGILLGLIFSAIAAVLVNMIPPLGRILHPLALVRAGFLLVIVWPLVALAPWPYTSLGFVLAPFVAVLLAWLGLRSNLHAELVPHSSIGRLLGTSVGPFLALALALFILIPMVNRGFGYPHQPRLVIIAVDGVDGQSINQLLHADDSDKYPSLRKVTTEGGFGVVGAVQPLVPARMWADLMTGTDAETNGIFDIHSTSADLKGMPIWEILSEHDYRVGLFQVAPPHEKWPDAEFDIAAPGTFEARTDPLALVLENVRAAGRNESLPNPFHALYLVCLLARHGVTLETIADLGKEYLLELAVRPSPRLTYQARKLLEFRIETDCALALLRQHPVDAAILRFDSLGPLFFTYWRYSKANEFGPPPEDVDASVLAGLGQVLPDAYVQLDGLVQRLETFRGPGTYFAVVSNHGMRSATDRRHLDLQLSPDRLIEACGWEGRVLGDSGGDAVYFRLREPSADSDPLIELENFLRTAEWSTGVDNDSGRRGRRNLLTTNRRENYLEVTITFSHDLTRESWVTMGAWSGPLGDILLPGEPMSGLVSGTGVFLVSGPGFKPDAVANNPTLFDIAPTLLHALGIEISRELLGRVMDEMFDSVWLSKHPVRFIDSYHPPRPAEPEPGLQPSTQPPEAFQYSTPEPQTPEETPYTPPAPVDL